MQFFSENWQTLLLSLVVGCCAFVATFLLTKGSLNVQLSNVKEWLLWAVTGAEKDLGGGTGQLKLRQVYDLFVVRFPALSRIVSFEEFSLLVDEALIKMRNMLESNTAVQALVTGGNKDVEGN